MKLVENFRELLRQKAYDTIACDIYGVIHDGIRAYPYSRSTLQSLSDQHVILLSNSTRLQDKLDANMTSKFNITSDCYEEILSSGVLTKLFLKDVADAHHHQLIKAACHATDCHNRRMEPDDFAKKYLKAGKFFLAGDPDWQEPLYLPLEPTIKRVMDFEEIDFVLLGSIRGLYPDTSPVDPFDEAAVQKDYQPLLDACIGRNVPILCANPDVFAPNGLDQDGNTKFLICPGYVGQMYEKMGGLVLYFGKPYKSIYEYLVENKAKGEVLCVGDNVATDIKGATDAGLDVVMVLGGVHYEELKEVEGDEEALKAKVRQLCQEHGSQEPTYIMPFLKY